MLGALPLTIHRGRTTLKHKLHANSWPLGKEYCIIKQHTPVRCDCPSFTWFPVRAVFPTDAELKADPARNPLPIMHLAFLPRPAIPSTRRAAQVCFLSLTKLQSQIPSLCSGFPLDLTRGLSTKHRLLIICLKTPPHSTGKYNHPLVVTPLLRAVMVECVFCKLYARREVNLGEWGCFHSTRETTSSLPKP